MKSLVLVIVAVLWAAPTEATIAATESWRPGEEMTEPAERGVPPYVTAVDVTGIPSRGALGSGETTIRWLWIGPQNSVSGIGWEVVLRTVAPASWLSDIAVFVTNSTGTYSEGFGIRPGGDDRFPGGPTGYSSNGLVPLNHYGLLPVDALEDGLIRLEFFETYLDSPGEIEGLWESGELLLQTSLPVGAVPVSPGTLSVVVVCGTMLSRRSRGSRV